MRSGLGLQLLPPSSGASQHRDHDLDDEYHREDADWRAVLQGRHLAQQAHEARGRRGDEPQPATIQAPEDMPSTTKFVAKPVHA